MEWSGLQLPRPLGASDGEKPDCGCVPELWPHREREIALAYRSAHLWAGQTF